MKTSKQNNAKKIEQTTTEVAETPKVEATPAPVDPMAAMFAMMQQMREEMAAIKKTPGKVKKGETPAEPTPAVQKIEKPKRVIWGRNPFCVTVETHPVGAECVVAVKGGINPCKITRWGEKAGNNAEVQMGDSKPFWIDRSYIFPNRETCKKAIAWAKGLIATRLTPKAEDFGAGTDARTHTGRIVAVFRENDLGYGEEARGFSLGFLDTDADKLGVMDERYMHDFGDGGINPVLKGLKIGDKIPHYNPEHGYGTVWFGFVKKGEQDYIDHSVPFSDMYDPHLVTDAFASEYGRRYVSDRMRSQNVVSDETLAESETPAEAPKVVETPEVKVEEPAKATPAEVAEGAAAMALLRGDAEATPVKKTGKSKRNK